MYTLRIVMANDPRAYREAIAHAIRQLRPHVDVLVLAPEDLEWQLVGLAPHLVVCSTLTRMIQTTPCAWIVLYPDETSMAIIRIDGRRLVVANATLSTLLAAIDQMVQHRTPGGRTPEERERR